MKNTLQEHYPHPSVSTLTATIDRDIPPEIRSIHEFHESKMQELQSISEEIKLLQEGISTVKAASSELFEKYQILPSGFPTLEQTTIVAPMTDSFPDSIPRFEQFPHHGHHNKTIQSEITELREKVEQVYYLALSAVSMAQGKQEFPQMRQEEEKKPQLSFHQINFPAEKGIKKEGKSVLPPRPSVSASSTRKKPISSSGQRPSSSIGITRIPNPSDDLLTPPTVSFVDTIEPPVRPPPRSVSVPISRVAITPRPKSQPPQSSLQQQLLQLAGGSLTENSMNSGVLIPPYDDLRIGESNSSVWERDLSLEQLSANNQSEINNLPNALLYGSITVRDAIKYDKENDHDDAWYRSYQMSNLPFRGGGGNADALNLQGAGPHGEYVSSLTEYTGNWKVPSAGL